MVNTYFCGNSCIWLRSNLVMVWHLCPVKRQRSVVSFLVRVFRSKVAMGTKVLIYCNTLPTSQISLYRGKEGFSSNTPLRNLDTRGCVPKVVLLGKISMEDSADRAVLITLYPKPPLNNDVKNSIPFSMKFACGRDPFFLQKASQRTRMP